MLSHPLWVLEKVLRIDEQFVGFCGEFFRASNERRQVIAAYLAVVAPANDALAEVGRFLSHCKHDTILQAAYGEVLEGHRGALRRAGPIVHDGRFYSLLHQLLAEPPHNELLRTIARLTDLDRKKLLITRMIPEEICRSNVVDAIDDVAGASDITTAFELLLTLGVDHEGLANAIRGIRSRDHFPRLWQRWALKARCSQPHPVPPSPTYHVVETAKQLASSASKFQNCARRYISDFLKGAEAFAVFEHDGAQAMVHLRNETGGWQLEGAFAPRNVRPRASLMSALQDYVVRHGVKVRTHEREKPTEWDALRRVMRPSPFVDFDFE